MSSRVRRPQFATVAWGCGLAALVVAAPRAARADIFHLAKGGQVEGQLAADDGAQLTVRTRVGVLRLARADVVRIEPGETPFAEYDARAAAAADTPAAQTELAAWCATQGLRREQRQHLARALELDADYAPARRALGHTRVGALWVDGAAQGEPRAAPAEDASDPPDREELVRRAQGQWRAQLAAIRRAFLDSSLPHLVADGHMRVLALRDPLVVVPLVEVLGAAPPPQRALLVEALGKFEEDEATLHLAVMGLTDPVAEIRAAAVGELARRRDPRVVAQYREALLTMPDVIANRAAAGLGILGAAEAVPDLIQSLTARRQRWVEVPVERHFNSYPRMFSGNTVSTLGGGTVVHRPRLVLYGNIAGNYQVDVRNEWRFRAVTVLRTEVLEALKQLTGQNFGFDQALWRSWHEEQKP